MRGHFRFTADYYQASSHETLGQGHVRKAHQLEHYMPVDISLPRQRIERMEDVKVVVESYDVEQISERELNLNVVIELQGIIRDETALQTANTFTDEESSFANQLAEIPTELPVDIELDEAYPVGSVWEHTEDKEDTPTISSAQEVTEEEVSLPDIPTSVITEPINAESEMIEPKTTESEIPTAVASSSRAQVSEAAKVEKIEQVVAEVEVVEQQPSTSPPSSAPPATPAPNSGMEWTRMFIRDDDSRNDRSMKRMRMCIVQQDDSLDTIAAKYTVQVQDLIMHNKLADRQLQIGQILYIPCG
jgi:stage VI sporulation protein D